MSKKLRTNMYVLTTNPSGKYTIKEVKKKISATYDGLIYSEQTMPEVKKKC